MNPTTTWICDACGQEITDVNRGWVEWMTRRVGDERRARGLRLVHHTSRCQYNERIEHQRDGMILNDAHLSDFLGANGLILLLSMIAEGALPKEEVLEMIKRLHVPGYEHARGHFSGAISEGYFEPNMPEGYYYLSDIEATLRYVEERQ